MSTLTIALASPAAPAEVRNESLQLVANVRSAERLHLEPGRYTATVSLPGGSLDTRSVNIRPSEDVTIRLGPEPPRHDESRLRAIPRPAPRPARVSLGGVPRNRPPKRPDATLDSLHVSADFADVARAEDPELWHLRFVDADGRHLAQPPELLAEPRTTRDAPVDLVIRAPYVGRPAFAQIARRGHVPLNIALPLAPDGGECLLQVHLTSRHLNAVARPAATSTIAQGVAAYLVAGQVEEAANLASDADGLLFTKLSDPIGAAIGGYALLRLGRLSSRGDWVSNLANWFEWLPDGAILAAEHALRANDSQSARSYYRVALSRGVPVFTEGLGLLARRLAELGIHNRRSRNIEQMARDAGVGRLTVTVPRFDLSDAGTPLRVRLRFGSGWGWTALHGDLPIVD